MISLALGLGLNMGGGAFSPASLYSNGGAGLWVESVPPNNVPTTQYQDSAGTTPMSATGQPVGEWVDLSRQANTLLQATTANRPTLNGGSGLYYASFNGTNSAMQTAAFAAGKLTASMDVFVLMNRSSSAKAIVSAYNGATTFFGGYDSTDSTNPTWAGSLSPAALLVNGGAVTDKRANLSTALVVGNWSVLEYQAINLSSFQNIGLGNYEGAGWNLAGNVPAVVICLAQSAAVRQQIRRYLGAKVGLSL